MIRLAYALLLLLTVGVLTPSAAYAQTSNCTSLANGATADITGPGGPCKRITNSTGATICVFTGDAAHWTRFIASATPMPSVTVAACPASCAGYSYGGYCYYAGTDGQSCDTVCGTHGGCSAAGTQAVGSAGSNAACYAVAQGISLGTSGQAVTDDASDAGDANINAIGCIDYYFCFKGCSNTRYRRTFSTTTCAASYSGYFRACACAN